MRTLSFLLSVILFFTFSTISIAQKNAMQHTVVAKENLNQIAKEYDVTVKDLKKVNNLKGDKILRGQVLDIPPKDIHIVSQGETLYEIGEMYNTSSKDLRKWNNLSSNTIRPNQKIKLIPGTIGAPKVIPTSAEFTSKGGEVIPFVHVVSKKENLFRIADRYGLTVSEMKTANNLTSDYISLGQELVLPLQTHKVARNETLSEIAKRYEVALSDLKKINNLKGSFIRRGKVLLIPG